ncbi:MAG: hypothetical protein V1492_02725 [Candidatus Micrarchaeota archaeon]
MGPTDGSITRRHRFALAGKFDPTVEGISGGDDATHATEFSLTVMGGLWHRTNEYGVYHRNPKAPLGKELLWIEEGVSYKITIPDVPVQFRGNEISLQKVVGTGIYPSTSLLQINQTGEKEFTVSPVSLDAIAGVVRAMNYARGIWAELDEDGFPDGDKPSNADTARYGWVITDFDKRATGYHGSFSRIVVFECNGKGHYVDAGSEVSRNEITSIDFEDLNAAARLLQSLKQ